LKHAVKKDKSETESHSQSLSHEKIVLEEKKRIEERCLVRNREHSPRVAKTTARHSSPQLQKHEFNIQNNCHIYDVNHVRFFFVAMF
jgi:hypothetical protein